MRIINRKPTRATAILLAAIPFVATAIVYMMASNYRLEINPADKLLPSFSTMADSFMRMAFEPDRRNGDYLLWNDTYWSLWRLFTGMAISTAIALIFGLLIGFIPHVRAGFASYLATFSLVPPIAVLPILFIIFGLGETSKVALIVVGTMPVMMRSTAQAVMNIPREMIIKAETLGASVWQMLTRLVLPQVLPGLINSVRLALVPAWIFLISAEAIASTTGLGYRIFLVRRYLAMDVILPYVFWITLLAFIIDRLLLLTSRRAFPWFHLDGQSL